MNVGLHNLVQRSSILYVLLMLWPDPSLALCTTIGLERMTLKVCTQTCLMRNCQRLSTFKHHSQHGLRSIELRWAFASEACWSSKQPQPITANSKSHVWVGPDEILRWLKCVLNEGCVQFGPHIHRQTSVAFMSTSPAPELANDFRFWHEYEFLSHMVQEHKQYGPGRYPFEFITQYAGSTKRYIDDIFTVSLGHTIGPSLQQDIISQNGVFYMVCTLLRYVSSMVICNIRPSPISIVREQLL